MDGERMDGLEQLEEQTPESAGLESYYDACVAVLRARLARTGDTARDNQPFTPASSTKSASARDTHRYAPTPLKNGWSSFSGRLPDGITQPPLPPMLGEGFHLAGVTRFEPFVLIAFQWHETGDDIYVHTVDLRSFLQHRFAAGMISDLIEINLFERLGAQ